MKYVWRDSVLPSSRNTCDEVQFCQVTEVQEIGLVLPNYWNTYDEVRCCQFNEIHVARFGFVKLLKYTEIHVTRFGLSSSRNTCDEVRFCQVFEKHVTRFGFAKFFKFTWRCSVLPSSRNRLNKPSTGKQTSVTQGWWTQLHSSNTLGLKPASKRWLVEDRFRRFITMVIRTAPCPINGKHCICTFRKLLSER